MRIGISTSVIQRGKTGVAQYVLSLLRAMCPYQGQHHFTVFVLEEDTPLFDCISDRMEIVKVAERFRSPIKNILWHQTGLPQIVRQRNLDVLHVPSYRRMLWPKPCRLVATIHDLAPFHVAGKYEWKRMIYGRVIARRLAMRQDRIIAISQNTSRDILKHFGVALKKVAVVPNGIDHDRFFPGEKEQASVTVLQRFGLQQPFILYVSRLEHPAKNHIRLISAFERFKTRTGSKSCLVFGGSDWNGAQVIHEAINKSKFAADIRALGFVPDGFLPNLYRAAEIFVYPSLYEGFGLPPIEAMACGCPVITSTRGSLGEVVGNAAAIIDPENVDSIANGLALLAGSPQERDRFRVTGLARAQEFNWSKTAEQTLIQYGKAVDV